MGDPLSITASVIAVTTFGLKSTKIVSSSALNPQSTSLIEKIYETLSSLCKSWKEFIRAGESLQALSEVLNQVQCLALQPPLYLSPPISNGTGSASNNVEFFRDLEIKVKKCED